MFALMAISDPNHFLYWSFVDLATKLRNAMDPNLTFAALPDWPHYQYKFVNRHSLRSPYEEMSMDDIIADPNVMGNFLALAFQEVKEGCLDAIKK
jgi:hypothetical protein